MYFKKLVRFSSIILFSMLGMMVILFAGSVESCVSTSKLRILSTSSPKNSMRYGMSLLNENTSKIPPLTENSPGSVTKSVRLKWYSKRTSLTKSIDKSSPTLIFKVCFSNSLRVTTFSKRASG